jgi:DNA helicase IV
MLKEKEKQNSIQKNEKIRQHTRKICLQPWIKGIRVAGST